MSQQYFRSLAELENTPEFEQFLHREFPQAASEFPEGVSRRRWMQLMGASLALGGVGATGCRFKKEQIAEFVVRPEGRIAGVPNYFATNFEWAGRAVHLLVTNVDGRPIKLDGNPQHPLHAKWNPAEFKDGRETKFATAGCDVYSQGAILSLYDPERLGDVLQAGVIKAWSDFEKAAADSVKELEASKGKGLAILFEPTKSPSLQRMFADVKAKFPEATLVAYDPVEHPAQAAAIEAAGGGKATVMYQLDQAKVIACLDADLLGSDPMAMTYARQFATGRNPDDPNVMNRLYVVESQHSVTGGAADFRFAIRSSQMGAFMALLEAAIDRSKGDGGKVSTTDDFWTLDANARVTRVVEVMARDLVANQGACLVSVGAFQPADVQQAALRINAKLGNIGKTVQLLDVPNGSPEGSINLATFVAQAEAGAFQAAWIFGTNPVYSAPGDLNVKTALGKIKTTVYLADYADETASVATWVLPAAHPLEAWGDVRAFDGTYGVCQPQIDPLLNGRSSLQVLATLAGIPETDMMAYVMGTAEKVSGKTLTKRQWKEVLNLGFMDGTRAPLANVTVSQEGSLAAGTVDTQKIKKGDVEVVILPSESVYDGRLANNGWLQELPKPITKLTWDNAALVSPHTAKELGLKQGELAKITHQGSSVSLPVFIVLGQAEGSITIHMGYGRTAGGKVGEGVGQNINPIRGAKKGSILTQCEVVGLTIPYPLATTQDHFALDYFGMKEIAKRAPQLIREMTLVDYKANPRLAAEAYAPHHPNVSMWKEPIEKIMEAPETKDLPQWAMTIDLNKCVGCNACVIACQAENNVPIVGKEQVKRGREMHWLRLDRYFSCDQKATYTEGKSPFDEPIDVMVVHQPVACVHCETAPCEQVCPVAATVHTEEGINAMAYNRCIGTRYCANNCPYKVRRFNYYNFNEKYGYFYGWMDKREEVNTKLQSLVLNPEVTVRGRGVMEKCTYCVQRVQNGKIKARQVGDGQVQDGDIRTACQDACPTQAIVFGNKVDKTSRVAQLQQNPRNYALLDELNVKPRTLYLARVRNVPVELMTHAQKNPKQPEAHGDHGHDHGDEHADGHA